MKSPGRSETTRVLIFDDLKQKRFIASLRGHVGAVYRLAWSADSRMLVSASKDTTLKVRVVILIPFQTCPSCGTHDNFCICYFEM